MSRKKTKPEDIRNPENYFNKYIAKEVSHTMEQQRKIYDMEESLEHCMERADFTYRYSVNQNGEEYEALMADNILLGWLETIRDDRLYCAVKRLTERQQIILTLFYKENMKQEEIAKLLGLSPAYISKEMKRICKQIMNYY